MCTRVRSNSFSLFTEMTISSLRQPLLLGAIRKQLSHTSSLSQVKTQGGARLDVAADGYVGSRFQRAFLTLEGFQPIYPWNQQSQLLSCYLKHENIKNGMYDQRIWEVEQATFTL